MKAKQSRISVVARFAYIFATIVTIFAQISGALTPLTQVNAVVDQVDATVTLDKTTAAPGDTVRVTVSWPSNHKPNVVNPVGFKVNGTGLTYTGVENTGGWTTEANSDIWNMKGDYVVLGSGTTSSVTFDFKVDAQGVQAGGIMFVPGQAGAHDTAAAAVLKSAAATGTSTGTKTTTSLTGGIGVDDVEADSESKFGLSILNDGPTTYRADDVMYLKLTDDMKNGKADTKGEIGLNYSSGSAYLQFDYDATKAMLKDLGWTINNGYTPTGSKITTYTVTRDGASGSYQIYVNGTEMHFIWTDVGNMDPHVGVVAMKALKAAPTGVTITPKYLSSGLNVEVGQSVTIKILPSPIHLEVHPVSSSTEWISSFPLYTVSAGGKTSILYDSTGSNPSLDNLNQYRYAVTNGLAYSKENWSVAAQTSTAATENFSLLSTFNKSTGEEGSDATEFVSGTTYNLTPNFTVSGNRYHRIIDTTYSGKDYYMPDGAPSFTLDDASHITLSGDMDGKAKKGQYSLSDANKTIDVNLYHIKYVQVVDDETNAPLTGVKVNLSGMNATTGTNPAANVTGSGELVPNDYDSQKQGPFYLPDGEQTLSSIDFGANTGYAFSGTFGFNVDSTKDTITLTDGSNATVSDDGQTIILKAHHNTALETDINIQKVAQSAPTTGLPGTEFTLEELDQASDALEKKSWTTDADGLIKAQVPADATTATRTFHVTETKSPDPDKYAIGNSAGYYAIWIKGQGFTAVGEVQGATSTTSTDTLATVKDGNLVIQDPTKKDQLGGGESGLKFQYVNAAGYAAAKNKTAIAEGDVIAGAQLPVLQPGKVYPDTTGLGFNSLAGVIYNKDTNLGDLKTADTGLMAGTSLAGNSTMATSSQVSDADGIGYVQGLWSQTGISADWDNLDQSTNTYKLSNAIANNTLPSDPQVGYQLLTDKQRMRAAGTTASDYYNFGSTAYLSYDGTTGTIQNAATDAKYNQLDHDSPVIMSEDAKTAIAELYKVKHVSVVDTNGNTLSGVTVKFTNMTATTGGDGDGELLPNDANGKPVTDGSNFVFPNAYQKLTSITDASGAALANTDAVGFSFAQQTGGTDQLVQAAAAPDVKILTGGQTVQITVHAPVTIKLHKQDLIRPEVGLANAEFDVWATGQDESQATHVVTDDNGDATAILNAPSTDGTYHIEETKQPEHYQLDDTEHTISWTGADGVTKVDGDPLSIVDGVLHVGDLNLGGGGGVGENGTNGGRLYIDKLASDTGEALSGAKFVISGDINNDGKETAYSFGSDVTTGNATGSTRKFTIYESQAPEGYILDETHYELSIEPDGKMILINGTENVRVNPDNHHIEFTDQIKPTAAIKIHKQSQTDPSKGLADAEFDVWAQDDEKTVTHVKTDANGDATATFDKFTDGAYVIRETHAPTGYKDNDTEYAFNWTEAAGVTSMDDTNQTTVTAVDGVLHFNDLIKPGSVYVGENGTNGGILTIKKVDAADPTKSLGGASFQVTEDGSNFPQNQIDDLNTGEVQFDLGDNTDRARIFTIEETNSPDGYVKPDNTYKLKILANGTMTVATAQGDKTVYSSTSDDGIVSLNGFNVVFADDQLNSSNGGTFTFKKVDFDDRNVGVAGARFAMTDVTTTKQLLNPSASDISGNVTVDLGSARNETRRIALVEAVANSGYELNNTVYAVFIATNGDLTVGTYNENDHDISTLKETPDHVLKVENNHLTFGDKKKPSAISLTVAKVDATDNSPITTADAQFNAYEETVNTDNVHLDTVQDAGTSLGTVTTDDSGKATFKGAATTAATRVIALHEKVEPKSYALDNGWYYVTFKGGKVVGVSTDPAVSTGTTVKAVTVLPDTANTVTFADTKQEPKAASFKIKKTDLVSDRIQGIAGGPDAGDPHFQITEIKVAADGTPEGGDGENPRDVTLNDQGETLAQTTMTSTEDLHLMRIQEGAAPNGYERDETYYYVTVSQSKGIIGASTERELTEDFTATGGVIRQDAADPFTINFGDKEKENGNVEVYNTDAKTDATITKGQASFGFDLVNEQNDIIHADSFVTEMDTGHQSKAVDGPGVYAIKQIQAATNYKVFDGTYYVQWDKHEGVTAIGADIKHLGTDPIKGADGMTMLSIKDGALHFANEPVVTMSVKTEDFQSHSLLTGASYTLQAADASGNLTGTKLTATAKGDALSFTLPTPYTDGLYQLTATAAPSGYGLPPVAWFKYDSSQRAFTAVSNSATVAALTVTGNYAITGATTNNTDVLVSLLKPNSQVLPIKKVDAADTKAGLTGARLLLTPIVNGTIGTTVKVDTTGAVTNQPVASVTPREVLIYRIKEDTAPDKYIKDTSNVYIQYTVGVGITKVGIGTTGAASSVKDWSATSAGPVLVENGVLLFKNTSSTKSIKVLAQDWSTAVVGTANTEPVAKSVAIDQATVTLTAGIATNDSSLKLTTDPTGVVKVTQDQIQQLMGGAALTSGTEYPIRISVDTTAQGYTNPLPRVVKYVAGSGFSVYDAGADSDKGKDSVFMNTKDANGIAGNLSVTVRQDTLGARDIINQGKGLVGATYVMTYTDDAGIDYISKPITLDKDGMNLLEDPDTLTGEKIPIGTNLKVKIENTVAPKGYGKIADQYLTYNSGNGYSWLVGRDDFEKETLDPPIDPDTGMPRTIHLASTKWTNQEGNVTNNQYTVGGSQILYLYAEQNLTIDAVPEQLNFGKNELVPGVADQAQSTIVTYDSSDPIATFNGVADTRTTPLNGDGRLGVQITQVGTYASPWTLKLEMGALVAEDGTTVTSDSLTMKAPRTQFNGAATTDVIDATTKQYKATGGSGNVFMTQATPQPGTYTIDWLPTDITLDAQTSELKPNTNYRATMNWNIEQAPE